MKNKITKAIIGVVLIALIVMGGCIMHPTGKISKQEKIKIGATLPLNGPLALYGEPVKNGMILAQEEINAQGGINGQEIELKIMDNQGSPKTVANDVTFLTTVQKAPVIINTFEFLTLASKDIAEREKSVMLTYTTYRLTQEDQAEYTFRDYWDMESVGQDFGKAANQRKSQKAGILAQTDSSYALFQKGFEQNFNGEIVLIEKFQYGQKDFRTELLKLKAAEIDTLVVYAFPAEASGILRQLSELGMNNYKLYITEAAEPFVTSGNEELLQKTQAVTYENVHSKNKEFVSKYKAAFSSHPRPDALYAYEDVKMIAKIMEECDNENQEITGTCIKEKMSTEFDQQHNKYRELPLMHYNNGWQPFQEESETSEKPPLPRLVHSAHN